MHHKIQQLKGALKAPIHQAVRTVFRMERGTGLDTKRDGLVYKNVLASFCHFHAAGTREWAAAIIRQAWFHAERRRVMTGWAEAHSGRGAETAAELAASVAALGGGP